MSLNSSKKINSSARIPFCLNYFSAVYRFISFDFYLGTATGTIIHEKIKEKKENTMEHKCNCIKRNFMKKKKKNR